MGIKERLEKMNERWVKEQNEEAKTNGDYFVDGLLYCHKCKTAKQMYQEVEGVKKVRAIACDCEVEESKRRQEEERRREQKVITEALRTSAFPDKAMMEWTFDKDDTPDSKYTGIAKRYVENFDRMRSDGKGILFYGDVGTGKTFLSACIVNALVEKRVSCRMTSFPRIANALQGMFEGKQAYIDNLNSNTLLVIDDLAAERDTEFMNEVVMNVIDERYRSKKPLIVTTNLTSAELRSPSDVRKQRVYSRLLEMCVPVEVKGEDRRKQKLREGYKEYKELLGL